MSLRLALLALAMLLAACPPSSSSPPPTTPSPTQPPTGEQPPPTGAKPAGATCLLASECESGVCEGEGCTDDKPGTCAPRSRGCTRDLRAYCGCDGTIFRTSGSCPGQRYASQGECSGS